MKTSHHSNNKTANIIVEVEEFLEGRRIRRFSPKSITIYSAVLKDFSRWLGGRERDRVQDVTPEDLNRYQLELVDRGFATTSQAIYLRTLRKFFDWLEERQRTFLNPAADLRIPYSRRKLLPVPSEEEMQRLLAQPNVARTHGIRDRAILETAYSTGARRAELCSLDTVDVKLEAGLLRVMGKGSRERMVPLGKAAVHWIGRYLTEARPKLSGNDSEEKALWLNTQGRRLSQISLEGLIRGHVRSANIETPLTPHSIRRAAATHMLRNGAHPVQIQLLLGHSSLQTLSQYLRLTITELKQTHARSNPGK